MCTHCAAQHGQQLKEAQHKPVEPLPTLPLPLPDTHCGENPPLLCPQMSGYVVKKHAAASNALHYICTTPFLHCNQKRTAVVLQRLGRSSLADLSAALGRTRSSDSVRQMAPTAPSSFLPFSPQTIAIGNCKWKTTDRCLALK